MKRTVLILLLLAVIALLVACAAPMPTAPIQAPSATGLPAPTEAVAVEATASPVAEAAPVEAGVIPVEALMNATYSGIYDEPITLTDGLYEGEPFVEGEASRPVVQYIDGTELYGDLDRDGVDDAVVFLLESSGGSGTFTYIAAQLNRDGQPVDAGAVMVEDRIGVQSAAIESGEVVMDIIMAGPGDPACCATHKARKTYAVQEGRLVETTPEGGDLVKVSVADLDGANWTLLELDHDQPAVADSGVTIGFQDGQMTGFGGCNNYTGSFSLSEDNPFVMVTGPVMATQKSCPDPIASQESAYFAALANVARWSYVYGKLALYYADGENGESRLLFAPQIGSDAGAPAPVPPPTEDLTMLRANPWQWVSFTNPVEAFDIEDSASYRLSFNTDATLGITADCNDVVGFYQGESGKLTIEIGPVTAAACPPESRSEQFLKLLSGGALYFFRDGNLYIDLFADGGTMIFAPASAASGTQTTAGASNTPRLRALDFALFEKELAAFTPERAAAVDAIVKDADIAQVQDAVKAGKLTYSELTLYFLARIKQYDETLRTMIELNPDALKEAQAADQRLKEGKATGRMLGIPVTLKDNIETAAPMHTTGGAEILLNNQPKADASFVKQLRDAGAVILGKANLSELAGGVSSQAGFSAVGGQVVNPHGNYSPAGSSAGSGAGTAAYETMVSVGSETSGSLIAPASYNGVVGMYPGHGVVDGANVIPLVKNNDSAGPIGRSVKDVAALLDVIDTKDTDYVAGLDAKALNGVNAAFLKSDVLAQKPSALEDSSDNAAIAQLVEKSLAQAGATVTDIELTPAGIGEQIGTYFTIVLMGGVRHDMVSYLVDAGTPAKTLEDLAAYNLAEPKTRIPTGQGTIDVALQVAGLDDPKDYQDAAAQVKEMTTTALDAAFADNKADVLVSVNNYHSQFYATSNYPAISVPLGLRANGMPVGVTLIGKPGEEAKLLSYAYALEQATRVRVNPVLPKAIQAAAPNQDGDATAQQSTPDYVTVLEAAYGAPSQEGFGSAVFYEKLTAADDLADTALAKYKYFVGDLWERYGEDAWMGPWKEVYARKAGAKHDILAELRGISDADAKISVPMILDDVEGAEAARAALSAAYDDPAVTELRVYNLGDGAAMSGLLVAGRRGETSDATFLVFLLD